MVRILGIDPGQHGGFCFRDVKQSEYIDIYSYNKITPHDIAEIVTDEKTACQLCGIPIKAFIEEVHSMPHDGKASAFSFGKNYGMWLGILTALKIPFEEIPPAKWQAGLKLRVRGMDYNIKKRALKEAAQKRFPNAQLTLDTCDATLIAEYGRQMILTENRGAKECLR